MRLDGIVVSISGADKAAALEELKSFGPFDDSHPGTAYGDVVRGPRGLALLFLGDNNWGPGTKLVGGYLVVGPRTDTVLVTVDDDVEYQPELMEFLVNHMPADGGAVGGYCEVRDAPFLNPFVKIFVTPPLFPCSCLSLQEPPDRWPSYWKQLHENWIYRHLHPLSTSAVECHGWLMGWGGVAYPAALFNDTLITALDGLPQGCRHHDDVWISG